MEKTDKKLTKKFNKAIQNNIFDNNFNYENEVNLSNTELTDKDEQERLKKVKEELFQKIINLSNWINERQKSCKPTIITDSKGNYVDSMYGATYFDYLNAKKAGKIKKYK